MTTHELWTGLESRLLEICPVKNLPLLLFTAVVITIGIILSRRVAPPNLSHIPILGAELSTQARKEAFQHDARNFMLRGYNEFNKKGQPFQVETSEGPRVVIGAEQMDEIRAMPDSVVDNIQPIAEGLMSHYTRVGFLDASVLHVVKADLSTRLGSLTVTLADEAEKSLKTYFTSSKDWEAESVYEKMLFVVAAVSTRIFLGEELCENQEWLTTSIMYTVNLMATAQDIKKYHPWVRPIACYFMPSYRKLQSSRAVATRLIGPVIKARRQAMEKPGYVERNDMTQWMMTERRKRGLRDWDYAFMADTQLNLSFAAIHTTSLAVTNMLYDLAAMPMYQSIIRDELKEELAAAGGWVPTLMKRLNKTDSFMKESQRHEPVGLAGMARRILKPTTLSDGTFFPANTTIIGNTHSICHDSSILLSDSNPTKFDGLRYYRMRNSSTQSKEAAGKHQFVSISQNSLMFGYGRHACPGRFFAANEIRLILAKMLELFEIREEKIRYPNRNWELSNTVDATKKLMMRRVAA